MWSEERTGDATQQGRAWKINRRLWLRKQALRFQALPTHQISNRPYTLFCLFTAHYTWGSFKCQQAWLHLSNKFKGKENQQSCCQTELIRLPHYDKVCTAAVGFLLPGCFVFVETQSPTGSSDAFSAQMPASVSHGATTWRQDFSPHDNRFLTPCGWEGATEAIQLVLTG